mmetsp:Transcript_45085/g.134585  ORF Transcript_45085/g.134585 Transcript_45085/m.134585 type:complete len:227 (-) Transcript_45085:1123-1803(-)
MLLTGGRRCCLKSKSSPWLWLVSSCVARTEASWARRRSRPLTHTLCGGWPRAAASTAALAASATCSRCAGPSNHASGLSAGFSYATSATTLHRSASLGLVPPSGGAAGVVAAAAAGASDVHAEAVAAAAAARRCRMGASVLCANAMASPIDPALISSMYCCVARWKRTTSYPGAALSRISGYVPRMQSIAACTSPFMMARRTCCRKFRASSAAAPPPPVDSQVSVP